MSVEIDDEDEITFPDHNSIENDKLDEKKVEENDDVVNECSCKHSHDILDYNPSSMRNYSPTRSDKSL